MGRWRPNPVIITLPAGLAMLALGGWMALALSPLVLDPDLARANLITLAALHGGLPAIARIGLFAVLCVAAVALLAGGLILVRKCRSARCARICLLLASQGVIALILLEGGLRLWQTGGAGLNLASYLANPVCGDRYYRLIAGTRAADPVVRQMVFDPELGWAHSDRLRAGEGLPWPPSPDRRPKAWFFGDSFMQGAGAGEHAPPAFYEQAEPARQAMNYGTAGYGVDQIWLAYRRLAPAIPAGDPVFVGILTADIDRTVMRYFGAFKPRLVRTESGFRVQPPPPRSEHAARLRSESAAIPSYAIAFLQALAELIATGFDRSEAGCARADKQAISRYAIDRIIATAAARDHALRWVIFVAQPDFIKQRRWRYDFLKETLEARDQIVIDSLALLLSHDPDHAHIRFYDPGNRHLNTAGNRIIGQAMAARDD